MHLILLFLCPYYIKRRIFAFFALRLAYIILIRHIHIILLLIGSLILSTSCYREEVLQENNVEKFEILISPDLQAFLHQSRDTSYTLDDPGIQFSLNDVPLDLKEIRIRGANALNFPRKSFSIFLKQPVFISGRKGRDGILLKRFKLLAMPMDYTYIENRLGLGLLEQTGATPLFFKFVELSINGGTQGVYMLVEDPEEFAREIGSEYILRRGYQSWIADSEYEPSYYNIPEKEYQSRYREIYYSLKPYKGEVLYQRLSERLDLGAYFRKMGIDFLLQNGDYTDEIFLYAIVEGDNIRFRIIPWDYDDLFSEMPHEVGVSWGPGRLYGERYYASYEEVLDIIGDKLIFSIEDDLDYTIATDSFLYAQYEKELMALIPILEEQGFDLLFSNLKSELTPFYQNENIVAQSRLDRDPTNQTKWEANMREKKAFLVARLQLMKNKLNL